MGSLTIKHKILRCEKCFMLKLFRIEPNYPQTTISCECNCGLNRQSILVFSKMMQMNEEYKVKCYFCGKEPKHPNYCTGCRRTYCKSCRKQHDDSIQTKTPHKFIDAFKYDFYCSTHQDEIVNSFCKNCFLNICQKCINEKLHNGHRFVKFTKMILSPQEEEALKQKIREVVRHEFRHHLEFRGGMHGTDSLEHEDAVNLRRYLRNRESRKV